jgi:flagellar capping protein FliD
LRGISPGSLARVFEGVLGARSARRAGQGRAGESSAPAAPQAGGGTLPVSKPLGESGTAIRSVNRSNSFLRMFMVEASHLPSQTRRAGGYHRIINQDLSLRVMILPGGSPMAVGGSAKTRHFTEDGSTATLQEFAYVSFLRHFITHSAALASGAGTQTAPPVMRNTDSLLSALQVIGDRRRAGGRLRAPLTGLFRSVSPGALEPMVDALNGIAGALGRLKPTFDALTGPEAFAVVEATSSSPLFLEARAKSGAAAGSFEVEVVSAARGHTVESAAVSPGAMGLAGVFSVNGSDVEVVASDSLYDLVAKVNRGEDTDGDGELDAGEDLDGDFALDGGKSEHGVVASFYDDVLTLRSLNAAAGEIQVEDRDGILAGLGMIEIGERGEVEFLNEVAAAREAVVRVDGREFRSGTGVFTEAIPGVELEVLGVPGELLEVEVRADSSAAVERVRSAVDEFNAAMREMNRLLDNAGGLLTADPAATRVRAELVKAVLAPVDEQPEDLDESAEAGLGRASRARVGISEEQLAGAARGGTAANLRGLHGVATAFNALFELGIVAREDDTLELDEERFAEVLAERPAEVAALFARAGDSPDARPARAGLSGGIAVRVAERLHTALGSEGLLALRRRAIESLAGLGLGADFARVLEQGQRAALLGTVLASGTG